MKRSGFTLLEIILVLALVVVLLGLLGMAVDVHVRVADASRKAVAQSQLARLVLRQMADDLSRAVPVTRAPSSQGGLRGNRQELQFDISRLPSLDAEPTPATGNAPLTGPPNDVRTVTYGVVKPGELAARDASGANGPQCGLLRGEFERAVFAWATGQGQTDEFVRAMKVLSPEVDAIEFTYLDGTTTYQEWDSGQQGKLPTAVKIAIALRQPQPKGERPPATAAAVDNAPTVYDTLVFLPNASATLNQTLAALTTPAATTSSDTKPSDSSSQPQTSASNGQPQTTSPGTANQVGK